MAGIDHRVMPAAEVEVYVPFRVLPAGDQAALWGRPRG